jgi:hypothetical protein
MNETLKDDANVSGDAHCSKYLWDFSHFPTKYLISGEITNGISPLTPLRYKVQGKKLLSLSRDKNYEGFSKSKFMKTEIPQSV